MLIFKLHNLHNPERVFYFPVGQSAPSLSPFIAICRILALPHIRRMRTYQSTLNDLERLNQLTKTGRNCSLPADSSPCYHLEIIRKFLFLNTDPTVTLWFYACTVPNQRPTVVRCQCRRGPKHCSCSLPWAALPDAAWSCFTHASLELAQLSTLPPAPLATLCSSTEGREGLQASQPCCAPASARERTIAEQKVVGEVSRKWGNWDGESEQQGRRGASCSEAQWWALPQSNEKQLMYRENEKKKQIPSPPEPHRRSCTEDLVAI